MQDQMRGMEGFLCEEDGRGCRGRWAEEEEKKKEEAFLLFLLPLLLLQTILL